MEASLWGVPPMANWKLLALRGCWETRDMDAGGRFWAGLRSVYIRSNGTATSDTVPGQESLSPEVFARKPTGDFFAPRSKIDQE
jgi:hypothetical protein